MRNAVRVNAVVYLSLIPLGSRAGTISDVNIKGIRLTSRALLTLLKIGAMKQLVQDLIAQVHSKRIETTGVYLSEIALAVPLAKCGTMIGSQGSVA